MALASKRPRADDAKFNQETDVKKRKRENVSEVEKKGKKSKTYKNPAKQKKSFKNVTKGSKSGEKPVKLTSKESHAQAKEKRIKRKKKDKNHYETTVEMKTLWEDLRRHDLAKDKRKSICTKIQTLVKGKEKDFIYAHDTSRIFQSLCKYAPADMRSEVFNGLKESLLDMVKSKYAVFFVRSMIQKGTKEEKNFIIGKLMNNARKLLVHRVAGSVVEHAYNMYANASQRLAFCRQFYGPAFVLFEASSSLPLAKVLEVQPEKKGFILDYMKQTLQSIVQKEALGFSLVHNLFYEYFTFADSIEKQAMAECLQEHICQILHTREGAKAAMYAIWYSSAKGRKVILKQMKTYIEKILTEEYGHMVMFATFDCVDDTKLVSKLLLSYINEHVTDIANDKWGRHVLMYLLKPRDTRFFNKEIREFLALGDSNPFSKKDGDIRTKELLSEVSPALIAYAANNLDTLMSESLAGGHKLLLHSILINAAGDKSAALTALISQYAKPYHEGHILDDKAWGFVVRGLLTSQESSSYAEHFVQGIPDSTLKTILDVNAGCFLLMHIIKAAQGETQKSMKLKVKKFVKKLPKSREKQKGLENLLLVLN